MVTKQGGPAGETGTGKARQGKAETLMGVHTDVTDLDDCLTPGGGRVY